MQEVSMHFPCEPVWVLCFQSGRTATSPTSRSGSRRLSLAVAGPCWQAALTLPEPGLFSNNISVMVSNSEYLKITVRHQKKG